MKKMTPAELEKFIDQNLRTLPMPRAPLSLEIRVRAQLQRPAPLAWYQQSWTYWPRAARISLLVLVISITAATLAGFHLGLAAVEAGGVALQIGQYLGVFTRLYHVAVWCAQFSADQAGTIPNLWLYGGLTVISGLYAAFFGLSAAVYRLLYHNQ